MLFHATVVDGNGRVKNSSFIFAICGWRRFQVCLNFKLKQWRAPDSNSFQLLVYIFNQIQPPFSHLLRQHRPMVFQPSWWITWEFVESISIEIFVVLSSSVWFPVSPSLAHGTIIGIWLDMLSSRIFSLQCMRYVYNNNSYVQTPHTVDLCLDQN